MQVLEKLKIVPKATKVDFSVSVLILDNGKNFEILGRQTTDWVKFACKNRQNKVVPLNKSKNILELAKENVDKNFDYTLILLNITPLLQQSTIDSIIEYSLVKNCNLTKLPVGYVAKNEYLLSVDSPMVDSLYSQNLDDFFVVENKKQLAEALEVLQERINNFHISNGVDIIKPKSVYIEPDVDIESGVTIYQNNVLKGKTKLQKDVILKENNVISDSIIGIGSCISCSSILGSVLGESVYISPYCEINNSLIGRFSTIGSHSNICNFKVNENSNVKSGTVLGENDESSGRSGKSGQ